MLTDRISVTANDNNVEDLRICGTHSENAGQAAQCYQISLRALDTVNLWLSLLSMDNRQCGKLLAIFFSLLLT